jgi:magnesium transporter
MIRSIAAPHDISLEDTLIPRRNVPIEELEANLQSGDKMWIDIIDATETEISWLESLLDLHPAVVQDLSRDDRRPTLLVYSKYIFVSLFQPVSRLHNINGEEIHCLISENCFVTVRKSTSECVDTAYNRVTKTTDSWRRGVAYFLYLVIQQVIDSYYPLLDQISLDLNHIEEKLLGGSDDNLSQKSVYRIKNQLITLRQMVAPQREALANMIGEERLTRTNESRDLFRHLYERLLRIYDVIDSQRDLSSNVLDLIESQESARLAKAVSRLTILSMIFLPLSFLTGLFELNFATTSNPITLPINGSVMFSAVIGLMILSVIFMGWFFRYKRWL